MAWDPEHYLRYADHRTRPGLELLARVPDPDHEVVRVVDLGCGTGHLTARLAERWPAAEVIGIDQSPEMLARAQAEHPDITWIHADIATWEPTNQVDVIFSNAALHWLDDHPALFCRLRSYLSDGGVLAVQMPDNWAAPTHQVPATLLDDGTWDPPARQALLRDRLSSVDDYRRFLQPATLDSWRTTYHQALTGDDPVWNWVTGSVLGPVLAALDDEERARFRHLAQTHYRQAYPMADDGVTVLPFSRLFLIARAPGTTHPDA